MDTDGYKAVIATTRGWDAKESGKELATLLQRKLDDIPDFIVLFSTIHYQKNGGFQNLLQGIYDIFPEQVKLIGGTIRGFVNNDGCYARGATALAVSSDQMDVAVGVGHNTKRNPKKAANHCANQIKKQLTASSYENGSLLHIISGAEVPYIPSIGARKIIEPGVLPSALMKSFSFTQKTLQMGVARDEEVVEEMVSLFPDYCMLSGATLDDGPGVKNYQFCNDQVLRNAVVSLGMKSSWNISAKTTDRMKKTEIEFEITKISKDCRIIHQINGKPALEELLRLLNWPCEAINEDTWLQTTFYFPIGGRTSVLSDDKRSPHVIGIVLGNSLVLTCRLIGSKATILTINGKELFNAIEENLVAISGKPKFGLFSSCITRFETLGYKMYDVREMVRRYMTDNPFIVFYVGGESTYTPKMGFEYSNISFNSMVFT